MSADWHWLRPLHHTTGHVAAAVTLQQLSESQEVPLGRHTALAWAKVPEQYVFRHSETGLDWQLGQKS